MSEPIKPGTIPLRERRTLAEEWNDFETLVIPASAGGMQRRSMKMAFYGGAWAYIRLALNNLDGGSDETELDLLYMMSLEKEIKDFHDAMRRAG